MEGTGSDVDTATLSSDAVIVVREDTRRREKVGGCGEEERSVPICFGS